MYKKFFIKFIIFFLSALIFIIVGSDFIIKNGKFMISTSDDNSNVWVDSWFDKKIEIAKNKSQNGKKIMFIGGSSTLFGVIAEDIEEKFKIPVVNFGTHASYQLVSFSKAKSVLNDGDIAIVPLEYDCYTKKFQKTISQQEIEYIFLFDKKLYKDLSLHNKMNCICFFLRNLIGLRKEKTAIKIKNHVSTERDSAYSTKHWNKNGDNLYQRKQISEKLSSDTPQDSNSKFFNIEDMQFLSTKDSYLNNFVKYAKENNVKLIFIAPPYLKEADDTTEKYNIKELWDYLNYDYIDNTKESFMDRKYFYDSKYHLTLEGAQIRTKQIIKLLDKYGVIK